MRPYRILVAEDDNLNRQNLQQMLEANGYSVRAVEDGKAAMEAFAAETFDLVVTDLRMPHADGLDVLKFIKEQSPENLVILVTGYGSVQTAVDAMKLGAFDFIMKPLKEDMVKISISRALSYARLQEENVLLKDHLRGKYDFGKMVGYSDAMNRIFQKIEKVSATDSTVLIQGESGTGKELVARAIHFNSERKNRPLVPVNCGAIPEELLESELFGHEKGAFTGAIRTRIGRFELAQGGTIFLDEIGDMSPSLQVKVLRVIQEKQFERIGGVKTLNADVRIIAATHQNLEQLVAERKFREDLFYRINVIPIHLPPLRERGEDIAILANHFLKRFNISKKKDVPPLSEEILRLFSAYPWPGNVRELENVMEMIVVMKEQGGIVLEDLPEKLQAYRSSIALPASTVPAPAEPMTTLAPATDLPDTGFDLTGMVEAYERQLIQQALERCGGVKNQAAKLLGLKRTTLVEKLKRL